MTDKTKIIEVTWEGPYSWPKFESENNLSSIPKKPSVYLQTFQYQDGYLIYATGITRRPIPTRFGEHTRHYMNGEYNVLGITAAQKGIRNEIWSGWGYARKHRDEFAERKKIILDSVYKQLTGFRIFITDIGIEPRILDGLRHKKPSPICDIPDRGMQLSPRWDSGNTILIKNNCTAIIHGLPDFLEI